MREVPLHDEAATALRLLRAAGLDPRWCFPSPRRNGRPVGESYIKSLLYRVGDMVGVPGLHPHALRHSAATRLVQQGVRIDTVQDFLGHADISTTRIYLKVRPTDLREAIERLDYGLPALGALAGLALAMGWF